MKLKLVPKNVKLNNIATVSNLLAYRYIAHHHQVAYKYESRLRATGKSRTIHRQVLIVQLTKCSSLFVLQCLL